MEKGISYETKFIIKVLSEESKKELEQCYKKTLLGEISYPDFAQVLSAFREKLTEEDYLILRSYTGFNYKNINAVLRNSWNYEENGLLNDVVKEKYWNLSKEISQLIDKFPPSQNPFVTFRGTTLKEFSKYGITSLEDLILLKGQYLYENGFTSTSLKETTSYFGKKINGVLCNIEIRYLIPARENIGIPLITDDFSYSKSENEYLLNNNLLSRVADVSIQGNTAVITVVALPKRIWNESQKLEQEEKQY